MYNQKTKNMNKEVNIFTETERKELSFKIDPSMKLMPHILEEYNDEEIRQWHDFYLNDTNHCYTHKLRVGETITGKLVGQKGEDDYLFDIGYKDYLTVNIKERETIALAQYANDENNVAFGTVVKILLTEVEENPYTIKGSISEIYRREAINELIQDGDLYIDALVKEWRPAGFSLELNYKGEKVQSFMPNILAGVNRLSPEESEQLVGQEIQVMIESYSTEKNSFISSRKKYLQSLIPETVEELVTQDKKGNYKKFEGIVTGTTKFGVFVQLVGYNDCLTGMIHKNNLDTHDKENHANIQGGDDINFYIKDVIGTKLNLTQVLRETLWDTIEEGQIVEGVIKSYKSFGILVQFDTETIGLVHNTELSKTNQVFTEGETIKTKVISVNKSSRKINLAIIK
jgi:ribosomal protein S1